jgi:cytochrome c-type biogenesis protein CcmH
MIDGMVARLEARLAAAPQDADGWIMLMRSRKQLGQADLARKALSDGLAALRSDAAARGRLNEAARGLGVK